MQVSAAAAAAVGTAELEANKRLEQLQTLPALELEQPHIDKLYLPINYPGNSSVRTRYHDKDSLYQI